MADDRGAIDLDAARRARWALMEIRRLATANLAIKLARAQPCVSEGALHAMSTTEDFPQISQFNPDERGVGTLTTAPPRTEGDYQKMRAYNLKTSEPKGWVGVGYNNYIYLYEKKDDAKVTTVKWVTSGTKNYLARRTSPDDRFLGNFWVPWRGEWAVWGLAGGGSVYPVIWLPDHSIQLDIPPRTPAWRAKSFLQNPPSVPHGYDEEGYCTWSEGTNDRILRFEFE